MSSLATVSSSEKACRCTEEVPSLLKLQPGFGTVFFSPGWRVKNTALGPNAVSLLEDEPEEILEDHKELDYESSDDILDLEL